MGNLPTQFIDLQGAACALCLRFQVSSSGEVVSAMLPFKTIGRVTSAHLHS